jgi:aspartyl aminopeptidase
MQKGIYIIFFRPILKIPNLAIHLKPTDKRDSFELNKELHLRPIFSTEVYDQVYNNTLNIKVLNPNLEK